MASAQGSHSRQNSSAQTQQNVFDQQVPGLQDLWYNAGKLFKNQSMVAPEDYGTWATQFGQQAANQANPAYQQQLAGGISNPAMEKAMLDNLNKRSNVGTMYESIVGGPGNTYIDPMIERMRQSAQQDLQRGELRAQDASMADLGVSGSDRHGVAQGVAQSLNDQKFGDWEASARAGAYDTDLDRKMDIAQQADTNRLRTVDQMQNYLNSQNNAQRAGLNFGQAMQGMGTGAMDGMLRAYQLPWQNLSNYANIMGSPTVLSSGSQKSSAKNDGGGVSVGG